MLEKNQKPIEKNQKPIEKNQKPIEKNQKSIEKNYPADEAVIFLYKLKYIGIRLIKNNT